MRSIIIILIIFLLIGCNKSKNNIIQDKIDKFDETKIQLVGKELSEREGLKFKNVGNVTIDLDEDGLVDNIYIEKIDSFFYKQDSLFHKWTDPGDFHKVSIEITNGELKSFLNINGWVKNNNLQYYDTDFNQNNYAKNQFVTLKKLKSNSFLLFCNGHQYASRSGLLSIFHISKKGTYLVFNDVCYLHEFKDLNLDGNEDIVTTIFNKEQLKDGSHDLNVYLYKNGYVLDEELSEKMIHED